MPASPVEPQVMEEIAMTVPSADDSMEGGLCMKMMVKKYCHSSPKSTPWEL